MKKMRYIKEREKFNLTKSGFFLLTKQCYQSEKRKHSFDYKTFEIHFDF